MAAALDDDAPAKGALPAERYGVLGRWGVIIRDVVVVVGGGVEGSGVVVVAVAHRGLGGFFFCDFFDGTEGFLGGASEMW